MRLSEIVTAIDTGRQHRNLSSAIRLFVLDYYQNRFRSTFSGKELTAELSRAIARISTGKEKAASE